MSESTGAPGRTDLWLALLRRLTDVAPTWMVWKNAESAFTGTGDIDAASLESDWPEIEREFRAWADQQGVGPVVVCRHIPGGLNLIAVPAGSPTFLEMGVKARRIWRGSTLFVLDDILPMAVMDPRGFRRLRPGAEGLFKLLLNGTRRGGGQNAAAMDKKRVRPQLVADPEGVALAARLLGPGRPFALAGARRAAGGGWSRPAMLGVEICAVGKALVHPGVAMARIRFRRSGHLTCPIVEAIREGSRRIPEDRDAWLATVARLHAPGRDASLGGDRPS